MREGKVAWASTLAGALVTALLVALPSSPAQSAIGDAGSSSGAPVYANAGTGRYLDRIAWVSWGAHGENIPAGRRVTNWHQTGDRERIEVTCELVSRTGTVRAYRPGDYANDGLPQLYRRTSGQSIVSGIGTINDGNEREVEVSC